MKLSNEIVAQVSALVDRLPIAPGRLALVLGPAGPWPAALEKRGYEVRVEEDPSKLDLPEATFHLALAIDALERVAWDRWALQKIHGALVDGGHLVLAARNFHAIASPGDLGFLASRAIRALTARARASFGLPAPRPRFRSRRYRWGDLERMLDGLGFRIEFHSAHLRSWVAAVFGVILESARVHLVTAERLPSLFGASARRPWPDPQAALLEFERRHREFSERRAGWLERNPAFAPASVEAIDPAAFRNAGVLVLAPHPDDELIGCGGTLARLVDHRARVTVVHATDGSEAASLWHESGDWKRTVRLDEARRVGEAMRFESLVFWREDNAAFRESEERVRELAALLETTRPALVFVPFVTDVHPDHRVLARMLARALRATRADLTGTRVLSYQVWSLLPANRYVDVTGSMERLERALLLYETAMKVDDYVHFCQDRDYVDSLVLTGNQGFVEAFFELPAATYPDLVLTLEESNA